ncbi:hypothetical protein SDC9_199043 [bioreactor metagenome]|uniref:Uncharacterized protein n=1 Tax=bioreactor metagenome TaxID=1076179 RepID=A0A645IJD3_9ZZZZ
MIEETVCRVTAAAAFCTGKFTVVRGVASQLEKGLGEASLFGQQRGIVGRPNDVPPRGFQCAFQAFAGHGKVGVGKCAVVRPVRGESSQSGKLDCLGCVET